ncbi:MAG: hypothetical protein RLZZ299_2134, partial [Pseudomonadota bacterium]
MTRLRTSNLLLSFAGGAVALSLVGCGAVTVDAAPSALVESAYEPAGQNCQNGGAVITFGVDNNGDNDIQDAEITSRQYVCDGVDGVQGEAGPDGAAGQNGAAGENGADGATPLVANRAATSEECAAGGYVFMTGFDDGAGDGSTAGDGVLSDGEVDAMQLVCNGSMGANGANGANGTDGVSSLASARPATSEECAGGGTVLAWGSDLNRDGNLDAALDTEAVAGDSGVDAVDAVDVDGDGVFDTAIEVTGTRVVCDGVNGAAGAEGAQGADGAQGPQGEPGIPGVDGESVVATTLEVGDLNCPDGGAMFEVGGVTAYACNGADGAQGPHGEIGPMGPQGERGEQGIQGA